MTKPPLIAIIGPFRARFFWQRWRHIRRAKALAREVWKLGAVAYCPHAATGYLYGMLPESIFLAGHLAMMDRVDGGILAEGWQRSSGSLNEKAALEAQGKPVCQTLDDLKAWIDQVGLEIGKPR